jgi:guanylate kinase
MATIDLERRGLLLILSSPSGAGKSTLARLLLADEPNLALSVSLTTRQRRGDEVDGKHYHFVSEAEFKKQKSEGALLESAEVHGNFYATPRAPVEAALAAGQDILFDIDWQGTQQIYEVAREDVVSIFVLPPSLTELRGRLERRATDATAAIENRLLNAKGEMSHWPEYDYVLVNDDLNATYQYVCTILKAERLKRARCTGMGDFVGQLLAE